MKKLDMKKITIMVAILLVIAIVILLLSGNGKINVKKFSNKIYSFKYDSSWTLTKNKDNLIELKHSKNGLINIEIKELEEPYKYQSLDTFKDDIVSGIQNQNKKYKLLGEESTNINDIYSYKLLFEKDKEQVLVVIMKQQNSLIVYTYEANSDYFDILLDSALNVIYNFKLKYDTTHSTKLESIPVSGNKYDGTESVDKVKEYTIHNNNYSVTFTVPDSYTLTEYNSTYNIFRHKNNGRYITFNVTSTNIYEELTGKYGMEYNIKELEKKYSDVKYTIDNGSEKDSYTYRITYRHNKTTYEKIYMFIPLDKNHTFTVYIDSSNNNVSSNLIDSIKLVKKEKYSKNITYEYEGNYNVNYLKYKSTDHDKKVTYNVKLYTPKEYREIDNTNNMYRIRYFGYNYDEKKDTYSLNYRYELTNVCPSSLKDINESYDYKESNNKYAGQVKYNGSTYYRYNIIKKTNYINVLVRPLDKYTCVKIIIDNNGKFVNENVINSLTLYDLEEKKEG